MALNVTFALKATPLGLGLYFLRSQVSGVKRFYNYCLLRTEDFKTPLIETVMEMQNNVLLKSAYSSAVLVKLHTKCNA